MRHVSHIPLFKWLISWSVFGIGILNQRFNNFSSMIIQSFLLLISYCCWSHVLIFCVYLVGGLISSFVLLPFFFTSVYSLHSLTYVLVFEVNFFCSTEFLHYGLLLEYTDIYLQNWWLMTMVYSLSGYKMIKCNSPIYCSRSSISKL